MRGIEIVHEADVVPEAHHPAGSQRIVGAPGSARCRRVSPAGFPLWLVVAELDAGTRLVWEGTHGDEAVYVRAGELELEEGRSTDGRRCPASGAIVVEADAPAVVRATQPTTVVHVGPVDPTQPTDGLNGPPEPSERGVHVVGPRGIFEAVEPGRDTHYYADSTCPTCRITLLYTSRSVPYVSPTHSHSQDEIIHLLAGEIRMGSYVLRPGSSVAIAADRRYGFRSGPDGFAFINYRRDASDQTIEPDKPPRREGGLVNGLRPVVA
ncbi:MAG TPA: hypothetical protein VF183_16080 [Acidimicrobiales bacterium]